MKRKLTLLSFLFFYVITYSQKNSIEIIQNFPEKSSISTKTIHPINYKEDNSPFLMLSAYSKDLSLKETIFFRLKSKNGWSPWTIFKKSHEEETFDRIVFEPIFINSSFSHIEFKSSVVFNSNIIFRLFTPNFTTELQMGSISNSVGNKNTSTTSSCTQPSYESRLDWCPSGDCTKYEGEAIEPTHIVIHNSANHTISNDYAAIVRGYWDYHVNTHGWADIGYNWLIDPNGVIYEGRGDRIRGAHSPCMNATATGICLIGDYNTYQPNTTIISTLEKLIAWDASDKGIDVLAASYSSSLGNVINNISGHKDGKIENPSSNCTSTTCPGKNVSKLLSSIRTHVSNNPCYSGVSDPDPSGYCSSQGNKSSLEWIKSVTIGSTTKASGNDGGYSDKTHKTFTIKKNNTTAIVLQPGYKSKSYNENWKIWIDLNNDGDFNDAKELLFDNPGVSKNNVLGSIKIPSSTPIGTTRMRISMNGTSSNYSLDPCSVFAYGEVEDYAVNITEGNKEPTCSLKGKNSNFEWISKVTIHWQSKESGNDGGYKDFSNLPFNLNANTIYSISLTPGYRSTPYNEKWKMWIDFNNDGDFSDYKEEVYSSPSITKGKITGVITIPNGTPNGNYKMRVAMNGSSSDYTLNPCAGSFQYGEVEDYTITISNLATTNNTSTITVSSGTSGKKEAINSIVVYPNPIKEELNIRLDVSVISIAVYNINGTLVYKKDMDTEHKIHQIETSTWKSGLYMVLVQGEEYQKNFRIIKQ